MPATHDRRFATKTKPATHDERLVALAEDNARLRKQNDVLADRIAALEAQAYQAIADPTDWETLFEQVRRVRASGLAAMTDLRQVQHVATDLGCDALVTVAQRLTGKTVAQRAAMWNELLASATMPSDALIPRALVRYRCSQLSRHLLSLLHSAPVDMLDDDRLDTVIRRAIIDRGAHATEDLVL
jgi:hypothetical protein